MGLTPSSLKPRMFYPPMFYSILKLYHLFPLHAPATLFLLDAPWGRFTFPEQGGREGKGMFGDLDGNWAWAAMEIVSPITFVTTIVRNVDPFSLTTGTKIAISLYLTHYSVRAVISPLILAPKRNPQHLWVTLSSVFFNLMNGYLMGYYLSSDPVGQHAERDVTFWLRVFGWGAGFIGNVYHDEILHDLRDRSLLFHYLPFLRSRHDIKPSTSTAQQDQSISKDRVNSGKVSDVEVKQDEGARVDDGRGRYKIPVGGLFYWVTTPNYLCEWFEWTCYAALTSPNPLIAIPSSSQSPAAYSSAAQQYISLMSRVPFPSHLLTPPWMFLVALLTAMVPRAIRAEGWYQERFGEEWMRSGRPGGRWRCLPGLL